MNVQAEDLMAGEEDYEYWRGPLGEIGVARRPCIETVTLLLRAGADPNFLHDYDPPDPVDDSDSDSTPIPTRHTLEQRLIWSLHRWRQLGGNNIMLASHWGRVVIKPRRASTFERIRRRCYTPN